MYSYILRSVVAIALSAGAVLAAELDGTTFVVLGDGLAAGTSGGGLAMRHQERSFGAQLAVQIGTIFPQAEFQPPGPGDAPGEQQLPILIPGYPLANVRISTAPDSPYAGIHVDGGFVSNVNTKPAESPVP